MKPPRGFIALTSVLILSALLFVLIVAVSMHTFYARFGMLEDEAKIQSDAAAVSCIDAARLRLASDPDYAGSTAIAADGIVCTVGPVARNKQSVSFTASATYEGATTLYTVSLDSELDIASQEEIPSTPE